MCLSVAFLYIKKERPKRHTHDLLRRSHNRGEICYLRYYNALSYADLISILNVVCLLQRGYRCVIPLCYGR